jgi:hypothetical protein
MTLTCCHETCFARVFCILLRRIKEVVYPSHTDGSPACAASASYPRGGGSCSVFFNRLLSSHFDGLPRPGFALRVSRPGSRVCLSFPSLLPKCFSPPLKEIVSEVLSGPSPSEYGRLCLLPRARLHYAIRCTLQHQRMVVRFRQRVRFLGFQLRGYRL